MRKTFDSFNDKRIADEVGGSMKPCRVCGQLTEHETLVNYGAQCGPCYGRYLRGNATHSRLISQSERQATIERLKLAVKAMAAPKNPRAWAYRLREREQSGERLTRIQRDAWRQALRETSEVAE